MNNFNDFMYPNVPVMPHNPSMPSYGSNTNSFGNHFMPNNNQNMNMNPNTNTSNHLQLFDSYQGYMRGNMFENLYSEYNDYKPQRLAGSTEQQEKLLELSEVAFASHDLNLYLDNFPNDKEAIRIFNEYRMRANKLMEEYERTYGPLVISSNSLNEVPWAWDSRFPWEVSK